MRVLLCLLLLFVFLIFLQTLAVSSPTPEVECEGCVDTFYLGVEAHFDFQTWEGMSSVGLALKQEFAKVTKVEIPAQGSTITILTDLSHSGWQNVLAYWPAGYKGMEIKIFFVPIKTGESPILLFIGGQNAITVKSWIKIIAPIKAPSKAAKPSRVAVAWGKIRVGR